MKVLVWILAAVVGYLVAGINPAIVFSKLIYHQDIRTLGSGNPGFTNFKRVFGNKYAWFVFALDLLKSALVCFLFGLWFNALFGWYQLGVAYTAVFSVIGHAYPIYYGFKGGKGFLVCLSVLYLLDWRIWGFVASLSTSRKYWLSAPSRELFSERIRRLMMSRAITCSPSRPRGP